MKIWTKIFKGLANITRLKIIALLYDGKERTVSEISKEIHVTFQGTSRHLRILSALDILTDEGKDAHVYYRLSPIIPTKARSAIDLFLKP